MFLLARTQLAQQSHWYMYTFGSDRLDTVVLFQLVKGRFDHGRFGHRRFVHGHAPLDVLATKNIQGGRFDYIIFVVVNVIFLSVNCKHG